MTMFYISFFPTCSAFFPILIYAQEPTIFFPHHVGDMWEYYFTDFVDDDTIQVFVIKDSIDQAGNHHVIKTARSINPIAPPIVFFWDTTKYIIDSLNQVLTYFSFGSGPLIKYKLGAQKGDQWVMWGYPSSYEMARVINVREDILFGVPTVVKVYSYYLSADSTDTTGLERSYDELADGFGLISRFGPEIGLYLILKGAIINGSDYGDITLTGINTPSSSQIPYQIDLFQNYPNPFNPKTTIRLHITKSCRISLVIYNITGRAVKMKVSIVVYSLSLIFIITESISQNPDPLSFFPHVLDNYWEYQHYDYSCDPFGYSVRKVLFDSLLPDSNFLVNIGSQSIYFQYLLNTSTFEVFSLNFNQDYPEYKLDAQLAESWFTSYEDSSNFFLGRVVDVFNSSIFGKAVTIKVIDYWGYNLPESLWTHRDYLASDFGLIRQDVEGGCVNGDQFIICAMIDGIQYGNCIFLGLEKFEETMSLQGFKLHQNYPNPFNNTTIITYEIPRPVFVNLSIYNTMGELVHTIVNSVQNQGKHNVVWEGRDRKGRVVSSGVYIYILNAGVFKKNSKMILLK